MLEPLSLPRVLNLMTGSVLPRARKRAPITLTLAAAVIGALALAAAAPAATRDLTREAASACRSEGGATAACTLPTLGGPVESGPAGPTARDPWSGAGGPPADPWGQHGTPRYVLGEPIVGEYAYIGSDGERYGVVRVRQQPDLSYRGVALEKWDPLTSTTGFPYRSETCDIPAGETMWWDINPRWDAQETWTFDNRNYFAWANYRTATEYSGDSDGAGRVECLWGYGPTAVELRLAQDRQLLVWPYPEPLVWRKLNHGGPVVRAHNGSGVPGGRFSVSFTGGEPDGWASFYVQIYRRGDLVGGVIYEVETSIGMSTTYTARGTLGKRENSHLRWCVTAYDAARNKRSDCARLITPCDRATKQLKQAKKAVRKARRNLELAAPGKVREARRKLKLAKLEQSKKRIAKKRACAVEGLLGAQPRDLTAIDPLLLQPVVDGRVAHAEGLGELGDSGA